MTRTALFPLLLLAACSAAAQEQFTVSALPLGAGQDYAPTITDSLVVMCSLRDRGGIVGYRDAETGDPMSDLYAFTWDGTTAGAPFLFGGSLNTVLNDGPAAFSEHGRTICFTRNQQVSGAGRRQKALLGLFFAERTADGWSEPVAFAYNDKEYSVMHPALSPDGKRLVFASDRPGGSGGVDLYESTHTASGWSAPKNLGPGVNSARNDMFPFIAPNGVLYFASDREGGLGKLDIYTAEVSGLGWADPTALPAPMNSAGNDLGYASTGDDIKGFFSSNRSGSDRIYAFERRLTPFTACAEQREPNRCYRFHAPQGHGRATLPLHHRWDMGDGTIFTGDSAKHCYSDNGRFLMKLDLVDDSTNTVFFHEASYEVVIDPIEQAYIHLPTPVLEHAQVPIDAGRSVLPGMRPTAYLWDLGDGSQASGAVLDHQWAAPGNYLIKLDVQGIDGRTGRLTSHCTTRRLRVTGGSSDGAGRPDDGVDTPQAFVYQELPADAYDLSLQAGEDVTFSVELFASKERVGLEDARFTEVRKYYPVLERYDPARGEYSYSVGQANDLESIYQVFKAMKQLHFLDADVIVMREEKVTDLSTLDLLGPGELDNMLVRASTVLFGNGDWRVDPSFGPQLDKIATLLEQHRSLDVVIEAHTDANGGNRFNLDLSQKRAQNILDHLQERGVDAGRMVPVGYGEDHPIASNDAEEGRAQNRRVEFRLVMRGDQAYGKRP
ncbi:MAG: PKD domain-containing protein [Flavobacteriales bacterium]